MTHPCGTPAAAVRHYRNGEKPCKPCRDAASNYQRKRTLAETHPSDMLTPSGLRIRQYPSHQLPPPVPFNNPAACEGMDPRLFASPEPRDVAVALDTCSGCAAQTECLEEHDRIEAAIKAQLTGVWGGVLFGAVKGSSKPAKPRGMSTNGVPLRVLDVLDREWLTTEGVALLVPGAAVSTVGTALQRLRRRGLVESRLVGDGNVGHRCEWRLA